MSYKNIETSREVRLWLGQIVLPLIGVVMMIPKTRNAVLTKIRETKDSIETKFAKR